MPRSFEGDLDARGLRFGIIASRFNDEIVSGLLEGALTCLHRLRVRGAGSASFGEVPPVPAGNVTSSRARLGPVVAYARNARHTARPQMTSAMNTERSLPKSAAWPLSIHRRS